MRLLMRHNDRYRGMLLLAVLPMLISIDAGLVEAQVGGAEAAHQIGHVTKVYNVADLLDLPQMLDPAAEAPAAKGGRLHGDAGFGGGGGMFRIPENVLPQFDAGGGLGGGGLGGIGNGFVAAGVQQDRMTRQVLEDILVDHLSNESVRWKAVDGEGGTLSVVGSILVVTHTADVQLKVSAFLDLLREGRSTSPTVDVKVRIVEFDSSDLQSLSDASAESLSALAEDPSAARLSIRCENHRIASVSSGLRRSYITSVTPVVGSNGASLGDSDRGIGYQPVTHSVLLGLFGRIKPEIDQDAKSGRIHVGIELASGPEEVMAATYGSGQSVDRVEISSARLQSSVVTAAETWTLAGTVAVTDPSSGLGSGQALPHLAILLRWQPVK